MQGGLDFRDKLLKRNLFFMKTLPNHTRISSLPNNRYIRKEKAKPRPPCANTTQLLKSRSGGGE